jgi:trehalose 6-phosphate phosphatase
MWGTMTSSLASRGGASGLAPAPPLDPARDALFLDLDGTLVDIAERPELIQVDESLRAVLRRAGNRLAGRLVVVSGRPLVDLDRHLRDAVPLAAGIHGVELRGVPAPAPDPLLQRALAGARRTLRKEEGGPLLDGILVEDKGAAIALHFRQHPARGAAAGWLASQLAADSAGLLAVQPGRMVVEVKPQGADKGRAVAAFLATPGFAGARPVFVGDDLTDEAGFVAATAAEGHGVLVGDRLPTAARYSLPDVAAVHRWLGALAAG